MLYSFWKGIVYRIDLTTREYEKVIDYVREDCYVSSESNRYFCWLREGERYQSRTLYIMDFETGVSAGDHLSGQRYLRPLAFMDEDLVYGKAFASDVNISDEGNETVPDVPAGDRKCPGRRDPDVSG